MKSKLSQVRACAAAGDWAGALRIAAKFPQLGEHREAITRAHGCITNPRFFAQLGVDCDAAIEAGKAALVQRYSL